MSDAIHVKEFQVRAVWIEGHTPLKEGHVTQPRNDLKKAARLISTLSVH